MNRAFRPVAQKMVSKRGMQRIRAAASSCSEMLESRVFLSGSVLASVVHGNLNIRGDGGANAIVMDQTGLTADQVRITAGGGTSINHQANPVILTGITHGVHIRMGAAADTVTLANMSLPGNVSIGGGRGVNAVTFNNVHVASNLNIYNGSSQSATTLANTTVGRNLVIGAGGDGQQVALQSVQIQRSTRIVSGGRGADTYTLDDSTFHGPTTLTTGRGADTVQLDAHGAPLGAPTVFDSSLSISLGGGTDLLQIGVPGQSGNSGVFNGKVHFDGGAGTDTLRDLDASVYTGNPRFRIRHFENFDSIAATVAPVVSSTDPANNATGVALNTKIAATFSEAMNPSTINATTVVVTSPGQVPISGTVAYVGATAIFTPASPLAPNTTYTLTVTVGAADAAGNSLASNFVDSFTTGTTVDTTAPTVSATDPVNNATGIALNKKVAVSFSEAMDPSTITAANVVVTGPGQVTVSGTAAYAGTTMTFTPSTALASSTTYTVTITNGAKDLAGNALAANFTFSFTTGATVDTTAPTVSLTDPASAATGVALNKKIAATFSKAIDPTTLTAATFTLAGPGGTPVSGAVTYNVASRTALFTPTSALAQNTTFTATVTTGAHDLAGNALASNYAWIFTTGAAPDTTAPTVISTSPADSQTNVVINKTIAATFGESIDATTLTTATFTVTDSNHAIVTGTVSYDVQSMIASFVPSSNLAPNMTFTATLVGGNNGIKDLAGNALAVNKVWAFTTGTQVAQAPINLGSASAFAVMATASISGTGASQINGDVGLNPGSAQGIPPAQVNGTIHIDDQAIIKAQSDLTAGYNDAVSRSTTAVSLPGNMGGLTFTPGLYTNSTSVLIQGAGPANNVTLDAQGDPNAVFIFQMGSTLTTGPGAQVILAGGAKASNIFWQVGTSATLNTTTIFKGNILAAVTITVNNGSAVEGRLLAGSNSDGSVTINGSTVTVPAT